MNFRLVGSVIFPHSSPQLKCIAIVEFLISLPKHCFSQIVSPSDSEDTIILIYSYDKDFDYDEWYNSFTS